MPLKLRLLFNAAGFVLALLALLTILPFAPTVAVAVMLVALGGLTWKE